MTVLAKSQAQHMPNMMAEITPRKTGKSIQPPLDILRM
jgi:hypothetical protein